MQENTNSNSGQGGQQKPSLSWTQPAATANAQTSAPAEKKAAPVTPPPAKVATPVAPAAVASASNTGTYVGIFVAGIVVGALIGWGFTSSNNTGNTATTASSTTETASSTTTGSSAAAANSGVDLSGSSVGSTIGSTGAFTLAPTQQAGFAVALTKISVSQPTWIVVYEDHNGTPGNAIGAGLFFPESQSGTVALLRATLPGQSYLVGQSLDDGDKIFSTQNDKPVRDSKGNALFTEFVAK